ncbi:MAG: hypothetical protein FH749_07180 [Firmicutes bacterium]|nr:hypothetical protein [Bacillota bacterium]
MKQNADKEIVQSDLATIYLGNLATVDSDLNLPARGERGSELTWFSRHTLFVSHAGKVTRPALGVGDRTVELVVTASYAGYSESKVFAVNVLEEEDLSRPVRAFPVAVTALKGSLPELPSVVVVENDSGAYTVAPVTWQAVTATQLSQGAITVKGAVAGSEIVATARITFTDSEPPRADTSKQINYFLPDQVVLAPDTPFARARDRVLEYLLGVNDDQMLYSFRVAAGLDTLGAPSMTGWDAPQGNLRGHTTGHYLSALALAWATSGNIRIKDKLDYMLSELKTCQAAMTDKYASGFLSAYSEEQFDKLEEYTTYPTIWAPYYTLHKILAGLRDCYQLAGNQDALDIYIGLGDWVDNRLSRLPKPQREKMWSLYIAGEFGGMNEVMTDLYTITGNKKYLRTARLFDNIKLFLPMEQKYDTLGTLHANQHIPQVIGAIKLFAATGDKKYYDIANNFWQLVTSAHIYSIGGTGETEMFRQPDCIGRLLTQKTAETCASYNLLKLTRELYAYKPDAKYMEYYERAMYNHILASGDPGGPTAGSTYFMPLAPGSRKSFDTTENTCCHGTGLENHFKYHESIYAWNEDNLFVNMYVPSQVDWGQKGVKIQLASGEGEGQFELRVSGKGLFALRLRKPGWSQGVAIEIDGRPVNPPLIDGYFTLEREWHDNTVTIAISYSLHSEPSPDVPELASLLYGPYVLAALDAGEEMLTIATKGQPLEATFERVGELAFRYRGIDFVPLALINREPYHVYFRITWDV